MWNNESNETAKKAILDKMFQACFSLNFLSVIFYNLEREGNSAENSVKIRQNRNKKTDPQSDQEFSATGESGSIDINTGFLDVSSGGNNRIITKGSANQEIIVINAVGISLSFRGINVFNRFGYAAGSSGNISVKAPVMKNFMTVSIINNEFRFIRKRGKSCIFQEIQ
jgi:hypothetical protein